MVRAAALVSSDGARIQSVLDALYFKELKNIELVAVISSVRNSIAMKRATSAGYPAYMVDPELFPTSMSHSIAVANKLKDMDIELVILAGYDRPLDMIAYQFPNRIIGTYPSLIPAFEPESTDGNIFRSALERGIKLTGATAYFSDEDGCVGSIILQCPVPVKQGDTPETLARRIVSEGECIILPKAVGLYAEGKLSVHGTRVIIKEDSPEPAQE